MILRTMRHFWLFALGVGIGVLIGYYVIHQRKAPRRLPPPVYPPLPRQPAASAPTLPTLEPAAPKPPAPPEPSEPDDLTAIDGIGPAYARALNAIGITTFAQLAQADPDALAAQIDRLNAERVRRDDWIGQAARRASQ